MTVFKIDFTGDRWFPFAVYRKVKTTFWNRSGWKFMSEHRRLEDAEERARELRGLPLYV